MKEQILHLDPHDDFISARDKMGWVQTQRVLLVWPPRGPAPLARRLDLVLLHRHAHRLGAQLALVAREAVIREQAAELGVFDSVEATRKMRWRSRVPRLRPERRRPRPDTAAIRRALAPVKARLPGWSVWGLRALVFLVGLAALAALAATLVPGAVITLTPASRPLQVTARVMADPDQPAVDAAAGRIPARRVRVEVQETRSILTTGSVEVPSAVATGQVVFTNLAGTAATIPAGASVRTTRGVSARFVTLQTATVEARPGATVQVEVRAAEPGLAGNVEAGQINAIDGALGTQLAVTNPLPTQGGAVAPRPAVAAEDRERLRAELLDQLTQSARAAVEAQLRPGEFLAADTLTVTQILAESFDRAVGEPADALNLTLRLAATALAVNEAEVQAAAAWQLAAQAPPDSVLADQPLRFARDPAATRSVDGRVEVSLTAEGASVPRIDGEQARRMVLGRPLAEAVQLLQAGLPLAAPPQIALRPAWYARWLPYLPWLWLRVEVEVQ